MTGAGIVLAEQDVSEVEIRDFELQQQFDPKSPMGKILVRQMAVLSVRMERSANQEEAAVASNVRNAPEAFDQARLDRAEELLDTLGESPRTNLCLLRKSPEGVDALIDEWQELRADLTREYRVAWTALHRERAENLTGYRTDNAGGSRIAILSKAIWGDFHNLSDKEAGHLDEDARKIWARGQMVELIDGKIAELEAHYETLDFETIELDRLESPARALFDPSKEATLARRYESEASRRFFKAFKELKRVEKEAAEKPALPPTPAYEGPYDSLGSSCGPKPPEPREPQPVAEPMFEGVRMPVVALRFLPNSTAGRLPGRSEGV